MPANFFILWNDRFGPSELVAIDVDDDSLAWESHSQSDGNQPRRYRWLIYVNRRVDNNLCWPLKVTQKVLQTYQLATRLYRFEENTCGFSRRMNPTNPNPSMFDSRLEISIRIFKWRATLPKSRNQERTE